MKIKITFLSLFILGTLASFTLKSQAVGGLKVKVELPSGVVADLEDTPIDLYKTQEDLDNEKAVKSAATNAKGEGTFTNVEAGTYFPDGMVETEDGKVYYKSMKVEIKAGQTGSIVLQLERNLEFEGALDDEDNE